VTASNDVKEDKPVSDPEVFLDLRLTGPGWLDIDLRVGPAKITLDSESYTTDIIGDLLRVALMLATGAWTARASFDGEPIERRLIAGAVWNDEKKSWRDGFYVRIFEFPDIYSRLPDATGAILFDARCDQRNFVIAVLEGCKRFIDAHGFFGPDNTSPMRALRALETALATEG
jgi:hypothetical protein